MVGWYQKTFHKRFEAGSIPVSITIFIMKKNYTHIVFILDRSGSMYSVWEDVKGGYKTFIEKHKDSGVKTTFSLSVFDDRFDNIHNFVDIQNVPDVISVTPRGGTALLDAIGLTINMQGDYLNQMNESDRPDKVLIIVQTDGQENSSKEFSQDKIKELINRQRNKYNWEFMFIGSDEKSVMSAQTFGFNKDQTSFYSNNRTRSVFDAISAKSVEYSAIGSLNSLSFSEEERENLK